MSDAILSIRGVSKRYAKHQALQDISFDVPKGSVFALLGPNGAGKTSLIRIITQITGPDEGTLLLDGMPMTSDNVGALGYMPEERGLYRKMKVGDQLRYFAGLKGLSRRVADERIAYWLDALGISQWHGKSIEELSKGMQQKVQFITTVVHSPKLIILDEPFSGFDPVNAEIIRDQLLRLRDEGATIMLSTHRIESVEELADHCALIDRSRLVLNGEVKEVRQRFKEHRFVVRVRAIDDPAQPLHSLSFDVIDSTEVGEGVFELGVRLNAGESNRLLQSLMPLGEIIAFHEELPSINDIFIRLVKQPPTA